jgi:hypothetical protein
VFFVGAAVLSLLKPFRLTCYTGFQLSFGGRLLTIGIEAVSNCMCIRTVEIEGVPIIWILFC